MCYLSEVEDINVVLRTAAEIECLSCTYENTQYWVRGGGCADLLRSQDLSNMYEEWVTSKLGPGPVKKLRLFIESVSAQMGSSGGSQPNAAGSGWCELPAMDPKTVMAVVRLPRA